MNLSEEQNYDAYAVTSPEELLEAENRLNSIVDRASNQSADFLKFTTGTNIFRIFPAHKKAKKRLAILPKGTHSMPRIVYTEISNDKKYLIESKFNELPPSEKVKYKKTIKKTNIMNSKIHGNTPKDIIEEYINYTVAYFSEQIQDKGELVKKLSPITDWRTGIVLQLSHVAYVNKHFGEGKQFGRLQITEGLKKQLNQIATRDKSGQPIVVDLYSHPGTGKAINVVYNKEAEDKKKVYVASLLWEDNWALSSSELDHLESLPSLEEIYTDCYGQKMFIRALESLELFDEINNFKIFSHDAFERIMEEISAYYPEENTDSPESEGKNLEGEMPTSNNLEISEEPLEDNLLTLSKEELLLFIEKNNLDLNPRATHTAIRIANDIKEVIGELKSVNPNSNIVIDHINQMLKSFESNEAEKSSDLLPFSKEGTFKENNVEGEEENKTQSRLDALKKKHTKK